MHIDLLRQVKLILSGSEIPNLLFNPNFGNVKNSSFMTGTLHVGDEIREINSESVVGKSVEALQRLLVGTLLIYDFVCIILHCCPQYFSYIMD